MKENQKQHGEFARLNGGKTTHPKEILNLGCLQRFGNRKAPMYAHKSGKQEGI